MTHSAVARPWRPSQIPNGDVYSCTTCHTTEGPRNVFGLAVEARVTPGSEDPFWDAELAALDSDGDGFTNGEELGDPDGDGTPTPGVEVTHPASPASPNTARISQVATTRVGLRLEWQHGGPPFLVQQRTLDPEAEWTDVLITDVRRAVLPRDANAALLRVQPSSRRRVTPFSVWMNGTAVRPDPVSTQAAGLGSLLLQGRTLNVRIPFHGLSANASAANIHGPAGMDEVADVLVPLPDVPNSTSGVIEGKIDLSALTGEQLAAFSAGRSYVMFSTSTYPDGEIRGQIAPMQLRASLTGSAVRPNPVSTAGTGSARFWLVGNDLTYDVSYANLSAPATLAHLHGPADADGTADVLIPLVAAEGNLGTSGAFFGTVSITPEQLRHLLEGLIYVNIHTGNHPDGEVRGQVIR